MSWDRRVLVMEDFRERERREYHLFHEAESSGLSGHSNVADGNFCRRHGCPLSLSTSSAREREERGRRDPALSFIRTKIIFAFPRAGSHVGWVGT